MTKTDYKTDLPPSDTPAADGGQHLLQVRQRKRDTRERHTADWLRAGRRTGHALGRRPQPARCDQAGRSASCHFGSWCFVFGSSSCLTAGGDVQRGQRTDMPVIKEKQSDIEKVIFRAVVGNELAVLRDLHDRGADFNIYEPT